MKGYEAMADALVAEGTEVIFGVLGGENDNLVHRLVEVGVRYVPVRHEQGAVGMADGYSRATGRPGVATVTLGGALTNAATPMTAARLSGSQVLVLVGDKRPGDGFEDRFGNQMIEQHPVLQATIGNFIELANEQRIDRDVQACFRKLRRGGGPIALNIPWPVLDASELPDDWKYTPAESVLPPEVRLPPDPAILATAVEWLAASERPLFIGGRGGAASDAAAAISTLGEKCGALLATTLAAKGLFNGDPFSVGVSGGFATQDGRRILEQADLLVGFGAGLDAYTLDRGRLYGQARVIRIDNDELRLDQSADGSSLALLADAKLAAEALSAAVNGGGARWRSDDMRRQISEIDAWRDVEFTSRPDCMDPRLVTKIVNELLPADRQLVVDIGGFMAVPAMHMDISAAGDFVMPWRLGAMGQGLPVAVGAALGKPDQLTVLFIGDGGIMTTLSELDSAARCDVPLLVIVIDDGGYGAERYACLISDRPSALVDFDNPDYAGIASAMGLASHRVTSPAELTEALQTALPPRRPTLIQAIVDRDVYSVELFGSQANFRGREG
jgi:thiamine pyrophosphate-dependent acetolactate synthase large subunit-like protein